MATESRLRVLAVPGGSGHVALWSSRAARASDKRPFEIYTAQGAKL